MVMDRPSNEVVVHLVSFHTLSTDSVSRRHGLKKANPMLEQRKRSSTCGQEVQSVAGHGICPNEPIWHIHAVVTGVFTAVQNFGLNTVYV